MAYLAIKKKSRNLSDAEIKCRENNMTRKLSDSHYVNSQSGNYITISLTTIILNYSVVIITTAFRLHSR